MPQALLEKHFYLEPGGRIGIAKQNIDIPLFKNGGIDVLSFKKGDQIEILSKYNYRIIGSVPATFWHPGTNTVSMVYPEGVGLPVEERVSRSERGAVTGTDRGSQGGTESPDWVQKCKNAAAERKEIKRREDLRTFAKECSEHLRRSVPTQAVLMDQQEENKTFFSKFAND